MVDKSKIKQMARDTRKCHETAEYQRTLQSQRCCMYYCIGLDEHRIPNEDYPVRCRYLGDTIIQDVLFKWHLCSNPRDRPITEDDLREFRGKPYVFD